MVCVSPNVKGVKIGLCSKGMCYVANQNPDKIFKLGLQASGLKKTKNNLPKKNNSNVIDFLQYLKIKRGKEKI